MDQPAKPVYLFGPFSYDSEQRLLFRETQMVPLAPKVGETLRVLLERHGRVVDKADLMREVWPDTTVEEIGLARNISQLRKALGNDGEAETYIETLPKRGYRFVGEVTVEGQAEDSPADPHAGRNLRGFLLAMVAAFAILALVYWQFYRPSRYFPGAETARVAVIPFECLSPELDCSAFPHGLNDLLVADVSQAAGIPVLSPSTVRSYQRARLSMPFMARLLGMDLMLDGTIQRAGERVRITARLIDVHNAAVVWSASDEYPVQKLGDAQEMAARAIAAQVAAHLASRSGATPASH